MVWGPGTLTPCPPGSGLLPRRPTYGIILAMKDITKEERLEYAVLSYLVQFPTHAKYIAEQIALEDGAFSEESRNDAFRALMAEANPSSVVRMQTAMKSLPELSADDFRDFFAGLAPSSVSIVSDFRDFVGHIYKRDLRRATDDITMRDLEPEVMNESLASKQGELTERYNAARDTLSKIVLPSDDGADAKPKVENSPADLTRYAIDETLLNMPGFVNEVAEYIMSTAHRPNRVLAFAGALALLAHLAGRKFVGPRDAYPNLYIIALAGSATGKDHPRKVIKKLVAHVRMASSLIQGVASGQGLEDSLARMPTLLCLLDEFDSMLRELKNDRMASSATEALWKLVLEVFTSSSADIMTRVKAAGANKAQGGEYIEKPSLSIMATAIPVNFYRSLSQRALTGGLLGRCLVFEAGPRGKDNINSGLTRSQPAFSILRKVEKLAAMPPLATEKGPIDPRFVPFAPGAQQEMSRVSEEADSLFDKAGGEAMEESVWGRSVELVGKLSLLHAISANIENPSITVESVAWAWRLVRPLQERMLQMAHDYAATSDEEAKVMEALGQIRAAGKKGIKRHILAHYLHVSKIEMDRIQETLVDRDEIAMLHPVTGSRKGTLYKAKKKGGKK